MLKMLYSLHRYISQLTVSLKNTGTTILHALTAHWIPTFTAWLQQMCCRSCTRLWHSSLFTWMIQWFSRCMLKSDPCHPNLLSKNSVFMFLFLVCYEPFCSIFIHQIMNCLHAGNSFITKFTLKFRWHFLADLYFTWMTEIHVALKYTTPWHTTLVTNWNWKQMANGANNCCILLTDHNQTPTHQLRCSPCNIILSSSPQVNYFLSHKTLSTIRHADSSAKLTCTSQQAAHHLSCTRSTQ
jgi:hypothetical protein